MVFQEKIIGRSQILEIVESAAQVAVKTYGLKIWGLDIVGGVGANTRPIVRIFVDTPWEGKTIPFIMPETRAEKSKKKAEHPLAENAVKTKKLKKQNKRAKHALEDDVTALVDVLSDESGAVETKSAHLNHLENADVLVDMQMSTLQKTEISTSIALEEVEADILEIAHTESVDINQCAHISRMIAIALEVEDAFADAWVLEVSSPGLERQFYEHSQLASYIGHPIDVSLIDAHENFENRRKFRGTLKSIAHNTFTLILDTPTNVECSFDWQNVKKAHLIHIFPDTTLKA